jgi:hypothetical protein
MNEKIIKGGFARGQRTYIMSGIGMLSAVCAWLVGDCDVFEMTQALFTLGGIYFLRKSGEDKKNKQENGNGKDSGKIS